MRDRDGLGRAGGILIIIILGGTVWLPGWRKRLGLVDLPVMENSLKRGSKKGT